MGTRTDKCICYKNVTRKNCLFTHEIFTCELNIFISDFNTSQQMFTLLKLDNIKIDNAS